jgi:hypothetical protein
MIDDLSSFLRGGMLPAHVLATRLRVCAPETAFRYYPTLEMRQWCDQMPGMLFQFSPFRFPGAFPHVYQGGLIREKGLFLFVPHALYERRRRLLLLQFAHEHLGLTHQADLRKYCKQAEKELAEGRCSHDHPALHAEAHARQVHYWIQFLAYRQEALTPDWRW